MKRYRLIGLLLAGMLLLSTSCSEDRGVVAPVDSSGTDFTASTFDAQLAAQELVASIGWEVEPGQEPATKAASSQSTGAPTACIEAFTRTSVAGDVVHYEWHIRVGRGQYDVIGLHRVVRESRPYLPIRTRANVFLQHGDYKTFAGCFLPGVLSPRIPDDAGFAVYLARNDVDVWGIDQAWCLVPASETNLSFMADWDMQRQVNDLLTGIEIARVARLLTGNGYHAMLLSGYSTGGPMGFAALNQETQLRPALRKIAGFIAVDQGLKSAVQSPPTIRP